MTVKSLSVPLLSVPLLSLALVAGCQHATTSDSAPPQSQPAAPSQSPQLATLPHSIATQRGSLAHFHPPQTLAGLTFSGEISSHNARALRYQGPDGEVQLTVTLYGLPAGWEQLNPERAVAGHYGQLRQQRLRKALASSRNVLNIVDERLIDLEGNVTATAQMHWIQGSRPPQYQSLLLMLDGPYFIRINNRSYRQNSRWLLQQSKRALAEFRAAQPPAAAAE